MRSITLPQHLAAAFASFSAASGGFFSSIPGGVLRAVAVRFPNPIPKLPRKMLMSTASDEETIKWGAKLRAGLINGRATRRRIGITAMAMNKGIRA
ncbi:hypothetical protein LINPERHAP1_LOCUS32091 [Linum perenne]